MFKFYTSSTLAGKSEKLPLPKLLSMTFERVVASIQCDMICENCCDKSDDGLSSEPTIACSEQSKASTNNTIHCLLNAIILKGFAQTCEGKILGEDTEDVLEAVSDEPVALKLKSMVSSILKEEKILLADDEINVTLISPIDDREEATFNGNNFEEGLGTGNPLGEGSRLTCEIKTISMEFQCSCTFKSCSCISASNHNCEQEIRLQMDRPLPRQTFSPSNPDRVRIVQGFADDDNVQNQRRNKNQMIHSWTERQAFTFHLLPHGSREIFVELRTKMKLGGGCDEYFSSVSVRDLLTTNTQTLTVPLLPFGLVEGVQASPTPNNFRQILLTFQFEYLPGVDCKPLLDRMGIFPPFLTVHKTVESKLVEGLGLGSAGTGTPSVESSMSYSLRDQSLLNTVSNISNSNEGALDKRTKIDVALAATRDLCTQQTTGCGAYVTRSTMFIRSSQKVGKGRISLTPSNNSVSLNDKSTIKRDENPSNGPMAAERSNAGSTPKTQTATLIASGNGLCTKYSVKKGGRFLTTLSLLKKRVAARKRFKSTKERRSWSKRSKKAKTTMRDNSSSGKTNLCASSSDFSTNFDGTSEIIEDDSLSGSSGSTMEGSYDLASWHGQLSMSWQSLVSATHFPFPNTSHAHQFSHENDELSSASEETSGVKVGVSDYGMRESSSLVSLVIKEKPVGLRSSLVIETVEDCGIIRHYLIPNSAISSRQTRSQLKRMKTKLRIFMDHVFVSRKVKGGKGCSVCQKRVSSRIGRKSYVCRDCDLACHKQCYTDASVACPKSSVHSMELFRGSTILGAKSK